MAQLQVENELAKIAISKNLIKEYKDSENKRTVYLNDGSEFQIYVKNPHPYHVGVSIYVNDTSIGNMLVLKPGQSVWLERYLDGNNKFLFSTYTVEDTQEMHYAISKNGTIKVEFYKESLYTPSPWQVAINTHNSWSYNDNPNPYFGLDCLNTDNTIDNTLLNARLDYGCNNVSTIKSALSSLTASAEYVAPKNISAEIETGRVERGNKSSQEFKTVDMNFEYFPFKTEYINILPASRKNATVEDTRRKYCSNCGKKVKPSDKFCSSCGHKLD